MKDLREEKEAEIDNLMTQPMKKDSTDNIHDLDGRFKTKVVLNLL